MEHQSIEQALVAAKVSLETGSGLTGTGFWSAVGALKRQPDLIGRYADRVAAIDQTSFKRWALLTLPIGIGTFLAILATVAGLFAIGLAYSLEGVGAIVSFTIGLGMVLVATHGLAHLLVGRLAGMRFTYWFVGTIRRPQPGVKVDYSTYLAVKASSRAWMHASGAIVTKVVPFALIGAAIAADLPGWYPWALAGLGLGSTITDIFWSTKSSDWKKFRREMAFDHIS